MDLDNSFKPNILHDILQWNYKDLPWIPDVVWSSPPCTEYSRVKTRGKRNLEYADTLVEKTLEIIQYFSPAKWFIENPFSSKMKTLDCLQGFNFYVYD